MTILVDASLACNAACIYCYNAVMRDQNKNDWPNVPAIKKTIKQLVDQQVSSKVCLHGGEPLLLPVDVIDDLLGFSAGLKCGDKPVTTSVQTNGVLLDAEHIQLLKKHKTSVGVSLDGFGELNRFRFNEELTSLIVRNLFAAKEAGLTVGVLAVIHKANGLPQHRQRFKDFILRLAERDLRGRLLPCVHPDPKIELTVDEARDFYLDMADFVIENGLYGWSPYSDMIYSMLSQLDKVMCFFNGCDPFGTLGGVVVTSQGAVSVCHKFMEEYIGYTKPLTTRTELLAMTDCKGCKFFENCKGGCPANAVDHDWRNKTKWCPVYKPLWEKLLNVLRFTNIETVLKEMRSNG